MGERRSWWQKISKSFAVIAASVLVIVLIVVEALQIFIDKISELLLHENLRDDNYKGEAPTIIRARLADFSYALSYQAKKTPSPSPKMVFTHNHVYIAPVSVCDEQGDVLWAKTYIWLAGNGSIPI